MVNINTELQSLMESAYTEYTQAYAQKNNQTQDFSVNLKTRHSTNITLEDWNSTMTYLSFLNSDVYSNSQYLNKIAEFLNIISTDITTIHADLIRKLYIDDEKVYLFSTQYETLHAFASSCISYKNSSGKTRIYLGLVNGSAVIGVVGSGSKVMLYNGDGNVYCSNGSTYLDISTTKLKLSDSTSTDHTLKGSTSVEGDIDMQDANVYVKLPTTAKNPVNLEFYQTAKVELIGYVDYQITQALSRIFGDSPEDFPAGDTLKELYDLIVNNKSLIDTIEDAVVKSVKDSNTTEINQILYRSYDYTYDAANITRVMLAVPADVSQGYLSGFSIKIGNPKPTIEFINASSLPLLFTLNGMQRRQEQLFFKPNQTLVGALMCDGINVYMYLKELQNLDQLE